MLVADLHRHDDYSLFDGFGKPLENARLAKEYGYEALGTTNHGTISGIIDHWLACKEVGIKPILGIEAYFMPEFKQVKKRYHLCLFIKNLKGYQNLNKMITEANANSYYYRPIITFELLKKYHEGIICSSACIAGYISNKLSVDKTEPAYKAARAFKKIFGDDFYIEIQPYKLSEPELQEKVNVRLMKLAKELGIKCILTSDSHYGRKEDWDTYLKMHEVRGHKNIEAVYGERYMPKPNELEKRFIKMHGSETLAKQFRNNVKELVDKCEPDFLSELTTTLPKFDEEKDSLMLLKRNIKKGLIERGKYNKRYWKRCMKEFEVIKEHGFDDYFLIVQEYVQWAKQNGIAVGPGRGSVCNSEVAYALGITDVDSLMFGLDFRRFLRMDKKKMPDIDMDFETSRRGEVIDHLINKYKGKAIQICSYGLYKPDNLLNDLFKICGVEDPADQKAIKAYVWNNVDKDTLDFDYNEVQYQNQCKKFNAKFQNILKHFSKMYKKIRYFGTHAAGVAIVGTDITDYCACEKHGQKLSSAFDLNNLEKIAVLKFDMLGLRTLSVVKELEELTGEKYEDNWLEDEGLFKQFREENTEAIFQFERKAAANILKQIHCDCMEDLIAANALNRPGPLGLKMPEQYAHNKIHSDSVDKSVFYELTKETYGTVVYQEQITTICRKIGKLPWPDADKVLKFMKGTQMTERAVKERDAEEGRIKKLFLEGAAENGIEKKEASDIFKKLLTYSFNKGHATGYAMISLIEMYYKIHYPEYFWYVNLKYAPKDAEEWKYKCLAVKQGSLILTPHVNGTALYSLQKIDGEQCIMEGLLSIKGVGEKAAKVIEEERRKNGKYKSVEDLKERIEKRILNARVLRVLEESGALEFNQKKYFKHVEKYNTNILARARC